MQLRDECGLMHTHQDRAVLPAECYRGIDLNDQLTHTLRTARIICIAAAQAHVTMVRLNTKCILVVHRYM